MRHFLYVTACLSSLLVLSSCLNSGKPTPMPRGYSSYNKEFKSVEGASPKQNIGYYYSRDKNRIALEQIKPAVIDLVMLLEDKLPAGVDKIYLEIPENSAFYNSFDYMLRKELNDKGYIISNNIDDKTTKVNFVTKLSRWGCPATKIYLGLAINTTNKVPSDIVGGIYDVPLYGYRHANNKVKLNLPPCLGD